MKFNNRAFTLVEVLVAVAITTIIGMGIMTMLSQSYKHDRVLNIKQLARDFHDDAKFMISSARNCAIVSAGSTAVAVNFQIPIVKDGDGIASTFKQPISLARSSYFNIEKGMSLNYGKIIIDEIQIGPYISRQDVTGGSAAVAGYFPVETSVPVAENDAFIGEIDIIYHSVTEGTGGRLANKKVNPFTAVFRLDDTHTNIVECRLLESIADASELCSAIDGASWDGSAMKCILPTASGVSNSASDNLLNSTEMGCVPKNYGTSISVTAGSC
jgi:prepilin-type N-terminal cleavage/methylation domain-containing protein